MLLTGDASWFLPSVTLLSVISGPERCSYKNNGKIIMQMYGMIGPRHPIESIIVVIKLLLILSVKLGKQQ